MFAQPQTAGGVRVPAPPRGALKTLAALDPERPAAVCRELTKIHEEVVRGSAAELAARYGDAAPKGEIVLVVGPARETARQGSTHRSTRSDGWWTRAPSPARPRAWWPS